MKINALDMIKYAIRFSLCQTPEGKLLEIQLCTLYSPVRNTGVINPNIARLAAFNGCSPENLHPAMDDLERNGGWAIQRDVNGVPVSYAPPFMDHLSQTQEETKRRVSGSGDYFICVARYLPSLTPIQRLAALYCLANMRMKWNFLGSTTEHTYFRSPAPDAVRIVLATAFDHPMMDAKGMASCRNLLATEHLPQDIQPRVSTVPLNWLAQHVGCSPSDLWHALTGPCDELFQFRADPRSNVVEFTPWRRFNQLVWDLERIPGGTQRNAWELANGFAGRDLAASLSESPVGRQTPVSRDVEHAESHRPPLGFHWVYEVTSDGAVILVGETTQTLAQRLAQHLRQPTNAHAHNCIRATVAEGKQLTIHAVALVHAYDAATTEVAVMNRALEGGAHLLNRVTEVVQNQRTIAMDSRFEDWDPEDIEVFLEGCYEAQ